LFGQSFDQSVTYAKFFKSQQILPSLRPHIAHRFIYNAAVTAGSFRTGHGHRMVGDPNISSRRNCPLVVRSSDPCVIWEPYVDHSCGDRFPSCNPFLSSSRVFTAHAAGGLINACHIVCFSVKVKDLLQRGTKITIGSVSIQGDIQSEFGPGTR